ncbi:hypothetical protein CTEN210_02215 [Chaetoceros tenuissimus]|uniref:GrpE protein homolog n=1 Tax=Chaetoceros tenuissimus TaxID=426638 RepID=A0AAD3CJ07_9STRA|nr:hypothetical protein CTEN210_02215 [Chaetoceros tenuissimus]
MLRIPSVALLLLALSPVSIDAFSVPRNQMQTSSFAAQAIRPAVIRPTISLFAEGEEAAEAHEEEVTAEVTEDEPNAEEEDPEITAIKKEIAELENTVKNKNRELDTIEKLGEQYTQGGYARKVAEMEQNKKNKAAAAGNSQAAAKAGVLQSFLPIMDELKTLTEKYEGNDFAKSYGALSWDFNNALKDMGVAEFTVEAGQVADSRRVQAVQEVHSEEVAKGVIIEVVDSGFEMEGNVMRMAAAVVSLGPEAAEEAAAEEASAEEVAE